MTLRETALINKSKQEMKLWATVYSNARKKGNSEGYCVVTANNAIDLFNEKFNDHGNVI